MKNVEMSVSGNTLTIKVDITKEWTDIKQNGVRPPQYLFVFDQEALIWADAVLGWSILYHQLAKASMDDKGNIQDILTRMKNSYLGDLNYYRWDDDGEKFRRFVPAITTTTAISVRAL